MLSLTPEAIDLIQRKGHESIYLELPPAITGCIHLQEAPVIRFGKPKILEHYNTLKLNSITVYIPPDVPDIELTISVSSFLGFKRIGVEGWRLA